MSELSKKFNFKSLRHKLIFTIVLTLAIAMSISSTVFIFYDRNQAIEKLYENILAIGKVTAQRSEAALAFGDEISIRQNINALMTLENVEVSCAYKNDVIFSETYRTRYNGLRCQENIDEFEEWEETNKNYLSVNIPIQKKDMVLGYLIISANLNTVNERSLQIIWITMLVSFLSILIAYAITSSLQKKLVNPIESLSRAADIVRVSQDYSIQVQRMSNDEVGVLVDSFNSMLRHIQGAHGNLRDMVGELEEQSLRLKYHAKQSETKRDEVQTLLASASHDLKQPLQAMVMFVEALKENSSKDQLYILDKLELAVENMRDLFTDLLDLSSFEKRFKKNDKTEQKYLPDILEQISSEFRVLAAKKSLNFRARFNPCYVATHSSTLQRIIRNLLTNAIRYTSQGAILLTCRKRRGCIYIEVWDTGSGIESDKLSIIFNQFVQVSENRDQSSQGVGLGLSIVKRSCELLGYKIDVRSKFGKGSMFRIVIPIDDDRIPEESLKNTDSPCISDRHDVSNSIISGQIVEANAYNELHEHSDKIKAKRVYLIDDESDIRESVATLLTSWRAEITEAESTELLFDIMTKNNAIKPDIIVSDYQLGEDEYGDHTIEKIRSFFGENIPAIIITGVGDQDIIRQLKEKGFKVLSKPVKPAKLRALMNHLLAGC